MKHITIIIFIDDDIKLYITKEENKTQNPWRAFESSLKSIEPTVGVVMYDLGNLNNLYSYRKAIKCNNGTDEYLPTVFFDPAFNAFHYKHLARSYIWWPGIDRDIENTVANCTTCQLHQPTPAQAPIHP